MCLAIASLAVRRPVLGPYLLKLQETRLFFTASFTSGAGFRFSNTVGSPMDSKIIFFFGVG